MHYTVRVVVIVTVQLVVLAWHKLIIKPHLISAIDALKESVFTRDATLFLFELAVAIFADARETDGSPEHIGPFRMHASAEISGGI